MQPPEEDYLSLSIPRGGQLSHNPNADLRVPSQPSGVVRAVSGSNKQEATTEQHEEEHLEEAKQQPQKAPYDRFYRRQESDNGSPASNKYGSDVENEVAEKSVEKLRKEREALLALIRAKEKASPVKPPVKQAPAAREKPQPAATVGQPRTESDILAGLGEGILKELEQEARAYTRR